MAEYYVAWTLNESGTCQLTNSKSLGLTQPFSFALKKNSPYNPAINKEFVILLKFKILSKGLATRVTIVNTETDLPTENT